MGTSRHRTGPVPVSGSRAHQAPGPPCGGDWKIIKTGFGFKGCPKNFSTWPLGWITIFHAAALRGLPRPGPVSRKNPCRVTENGDSGRTLLRTASRAPQRSFQSLFLLIPTGFFGFRSLLESLSTLPRWRRHASRAPVRPCPTQPAPCRPPVAGIHGPSAWRPLLRPFTLAPFRFLFVGKSGPSFSSVVGGARGRLFRLWAFRLAVWSAAAQDRGAARRVR
jgi:hypothetical protein